MPAGWVAAAGAVAGLIGSSMSSNAAKSAANQQAAAAKDANATQLAMYNQTRQDNMPALDARNQALTQLQTMYGPNGSFSQMPTAAQVMAQPGYQFGLQQGQQGLDRQAAAAGRLYSGAQLKAASQYGNDYATTKYGDAFNQMQAFNTQKANGLQSLAGLGQSAAGTVAASNANTANQVGQNLVGIGNARGAATIGAGNAWGNAMNNIGGWGMQHNWGTPSTGGGSLWSSGSSGEAPGYMSFNDPAWGSYNGG